MLLADPEALKQYLIDIKPIEEKMAKHRKQFWEREIKKFNMKKKKSN